MGRVVARFLLGASAFQMRGGGHIVLGELNDTIRILAIAGSPPPATTGGCRWPRSA